jgi:hypothetical protein
MTRSIAISATVPSSTGTYLLPIEACAPSSLFVYARLSKFSSRAEDLQSTPIFQHYLEETLDDRRKTIACCQQKGIVPLITSLTYACAALRRQQMLDTLETSIPSSVKKYCFDFSVTLYYFRTVLQQALHRRKLSFHAYPMKWSLAITVSVGNVRITLDKVNHNLIIADETAYVRAGEPLLSSPSMLAPRSTSCLTPPQITR